MRRVSVLVSLLAVLLVGLAVGPGLAAGATAQEGTPVPEEDFELPEGVSFAALGYGTTEELTAPPADLALFRFGLEPGAAFPLSEEASVALVYVESGVLTVIMDGPMTVLRAAGTGTPFPTETEDFAEGEVFDLAAGDSAIFPAGVAGQVRNGSDEPVALLVADVGPTQGQAGMPAAGTPAP